MSELHRYSIKQGQFCQGCPMSRDDDGDWYKAEAVDARLALMQRAVDWLTFQAELYRVEIPVDLVDIISNSDRAG